MKLKNEDDELLLKKIDATISKLCKGKGKRLNKFIAEVNASILEGKNNGKRSNTRSTN